MCNCLLNLLFPCRTNNYPTPPTCGCNIPTFPVNHGCGCNRRQNNYCGYYNAQANAALISAYGASTVEFEPVQTTVPYVYQYDGVRGGNNYSNNCCGCYNCCCCGGGNQQPYSNLSAINGLR